MSPHLRAVFFYVVSLYLFTVPLALYLLALVSVVGAVRIGVALHTLVIVPLAIAEVRANGAVARGETVP
jgi:hypothetical protein